MSQNETQFADKRLAAVCGLYCGACSLYIGTNEDPKRLEAIAERFQMSVYEVRCQGCRSETLSFYCKTCKFKQCTAEKGIDFCGECSVYSCDDLKTFQEERPHRIELWDSQKRISEVGYEQWLAEMAEHYSCPECQTINSAYDLACRECGASPSCAYVGKHQDTIAQYFKK